MPTIQPVREWLGLSFEPFIQAGGIVIQPAGLTIAAFATRGVVIDGDEWHDIDQPTAAITLAGDGNHWIALHRSQVEVMAGWTRVPGTHYIEQVSVVQPENPPGGLVFSQAVVTGGIITRVRNFAYRSPVDALMRRHSVTSWGAQAIGAAFDDTPAILAAVAAGDDSFLEKESHTVHFPLPKAGGYYHLTQTISFMDHWNMSITADDWRMFSRSTGEGRRALIKWHGGTNQNMLEWDDVQGFTATNISTDARETVGVVGFSIGPTGQQTSSLKYMTFNNCSAQFGDIGFRVADFAANGPDAASITFNNCYAENNATQGFAVNSGNAIVGCTMLTATNNGPAPTGGKRGANIFLGSGSLTITGMHTAGQGASQPADADIQQDAGSLRINGGWSDTHGLLYQGGGGVNEGVYLHGIRHFEGSMNNTNTPLSINYNGQSPISLESCKFFNSVQLNPGNNPKCVSSSIHFYQASATFVGGAVETLRGVITLANEDKQGAEISIGRPARDDMGFVMPLTVWSNSNRPFFIFANSDTDMASSIMSNSASANFDLIMNGYFDGTNFRSAVPGPVGRFVAQGGLAPFMLLGYDANATSAGEVQTYPNILLFIALVNTGSGNRSAMRLGNNTLTWAGAVPTGGITAQGDVAFSESAQAGSRAGWMRTGAGTYEGFGQVGNRSAAVTPVGTITPNFIGEEFLDTTLSVWYKSHGLGVSDWKQITT